MERSARKSGPTTCRSPRWKRCFARTVNSKSPSSSAKNKQAGPVRSKVRCTKRRGTTGLKSTALCSLAASCFAPFAGTPSKPSSTFTPADAVHARLINALRRGGGQAELWHHEHGASHRRVVYSAHDPRDRAAVLHHGCPCDSTLLQGKTWLRLCQHLAGPAGVRD